MLRQVISNQRNGSTFACKMISKEPGWTLPPNLEFFSDSWTIDPIEFIPGRKDARPNRIKKVEKLNWLIHQKQKYFHHPIKITLTDLEHSLTEKYLEWLHGYKLLHIIRDPFDRFISRAYADKTGWKYEHIHRPTEKVTIDFWDFYHWKENEDFLQPKLETILSLHGNYELVPYEALGTYFDSTEFWSDLAYSDLVNNYHELREMITPLV
tara:strand:- start:1371 stop:2000 length:630 start_codon:yes stop_codon:yes gene_type:complete